MLRVCKIRGAGARSVQSRRDVNSTFSGYGRWRGERCRWLADRGRQLASDQFDALKVLVH